MNDFKNYNVGFVGYGNIAHALISGLITSGFDSKNIWASARNYAKLTSLQQKFRVSITNDNNTILEKCNIIILCVKPQQMQNLCAKFSRELLRNATLIISMAAGVTIKMLETWLGHYPIIRAMPNTPMQYRKGIIGFSANVLTDKALYNLATNLFNTTSKTFYFANEKLLDAVTALSGSGPAYIFSMMDALQQAAIASGISPDTARSMTAQTVLGAAEMVLKSQKDPITLQNEIVSKGGTTEKALEVLKIHKFHDIVASAFNAAKERSQEISCELANKES